MKLISYVLLATLPAFGAGNVVFKSENPKEIMIQTQESPVYKVSKFKKAVAIDGQWDKPQWKKVKALDITHYMGEVSKFQPNVQAKMAYDDANVYVIFQVEDRFVKSVTTEYNGPVSTDSCVEFFFSPATAEPLNYFNLEVNAGGTPLMFYIKEAITRNSSRLTPDELKQIEIAHSLPAVVDPEITEPVTWTVEYRVPLSILEKYSNINKPAKGVKWKANFYKTGSKTSNPNYITWAKVDFPRPNFHLPKFFGTIEFQ